MPYASEHLDIQASQNKMSPVRTTLKIDDDLYQAEKSIAKIENRTIGQVVSALIRKALRNSEYRDNADDIPAFRVSENASPIALDIVREAGEDAE
jgi:hypothetical protein